MRNDRRTLVIAEISFSAETRLKTKRKSPKSAASKSPSLFTEHEQHPSRPARYVSDAELRYTKVPLHLRWTSRWVLLLAKGTLRSYSVILQSTNIFPSLFPLSQNTVIIRR